MRKRPGNNIQYTYVLLNNELIFISSIFLGIDHNYTGIGDPILFETMIFGGEHDQEQARHTSAANAIASQNRAVENLLSYGGFILSRAQVCCFGNFWEQNRLTKNNSDYDGNQKKLQKG